MGFNITPDNEPCKSSYKTLKNIKLNTKVAMWHIPYNPKYSLFDTDNSHWFEAENKYSENEITSAEKNYTLVFQDTKFQHKSLLLKIIQLKSYQYILTVIE